MSAVMEREEESTPLVAAGPGPGNVQLLTFRLDDQEYALNIANVVQVVRMVAVTRSPKAPEYVEGMINLRGKVIPVINLRKRFLLPDRPFDLDSHLLIARSNGRTMALLVDVVSEMLTVSASNLEYPSDDTPHMAEDLWAVGKLGERLVLVLDPEKALAFDLR
jgi:purine-binding chemotaxis protein CheW